MNMTIPVSFATKPGFFSASDAGVDGTKRVQHRRKTGDSVKKLTSLLLFICTKAWYNHDTTNNGGLFMRPVEKWIWLPEAAYPQNQTTRYSERVHVRTEKNYTIAAFSRIYSFGKAI